MATMPLKSGEIYHLQYLSGLLGIVAEGEKAMGQRIAFAGLESRYPELVKECQAVFKALLLTVPQEKLRILKRNLDAMSLTININRAAVEKEEETVVPIDDLREVCRKACADCALCEGGKLEMAKCTFRKHLKHVLMVDFDETDGICMAAKIDW